MKRNIRWLRNRKEIIFIFISFIFFLFFKVFEENNITRLRYEITKLENEVNKEKKVNRELEIEIEELTLPSRIEALAQSIGLISVRPSQIVFIKDVEEAPIKKKIQQTFVAKLLDVFAKE